MERPRSKITFRDSDRRSQLDAPADADWTAGGLVFETDCTPEVYTYSMVHCGNMVKHIPVHLFPV